jgi:hypothetical protein
MAGNTALRQSVHAPGRGGIGVGQQATAPGRPRDKNPDGRLFNSSGHRSNDVTTTRLESIRGQHAKPCYAGESSRLDKAAAG